MGPLRSVRNQYPGVNAHLHSYWQGRGGWSRFHTNHIADLLRALRPLLLPRGYDADHPRIELLRHKSLTVTKSYGFEPLIHTPELAATIRADWKATQPLLTWLTDHS